MASAAPGRSLQRRRDARRRGLPYRSTVSGAPRHVIRYYISQFLPTSTREDVYPMRALHLASVQLQRVARGRGLRTRFRSVNWELLSGADRYSTAVQLARPSPVGKEAAVQSSEPSEAPAGMLSKYLALVQAREASGHELHAYEGAGYMVWCAARVEAWWRIVRTRWFFATLRFRVYHIASQQIQFAWKAYQQETYFRLGNAGPRLLSFVHKKSRNKRGGGGGRGRSRSVSPTPSSPILTPPLESTTPLPPLTPPRWSTPEDRGAFALQSLWRRFTAARIYKYYRDLIQFRLTGDPAVLLRTINPREASLFDKATGIHVRFRLGGASFPPTLYYKVFLLNALCDVGSFAPRDYSKKSAFPSSMTTAQAEPSTTTAPTLGQIRVGGSYFGTQVNGLGPDGMSKWYKRVENNGWRPVTHRAASDAAYVTSSSSVGPEHGGTRAQSSSSGGGRAAVVPPHGAIPPEELASLSKEKGGTAFHYSRVKRAEDKAAVRKAKKRAWLQHMYRDGLARERGDNDGNGNDDDNVGTGNNDDEGTGANPAPGNNHSKEDANTTAGPVAGKGTTSQTKKGGTELYDSTLFHDDGLDVDDLAGVLAWSAELDYEAYVANWHVLATSAAAGHNYHAAGNGTAAARSRRAAAVNGNGGREGLPEPDWITLNEQFQADLS